IVKELKHRDISKYNVQLALQEINQQEYLNVFEELAKKRLAEIKDKELQKRRKKLADYLLYRGWESELVYGKVFELLPTTK
ncbi:MAG: recombinase RecX, partial [Arenibacter sp.]|nr:recombinase RecX [Arenibacter sp.]